MRLVQLELGISERRACRALGQPRGTQRYRGRRPAREADLVRRLHELAEEYPQFGYRRLAALVLAEGWQVSRKRVERLCRGARIRAATRHSRPRGRGAPMVGRGLRPDQVWCCDVLKDEDQFGRQLYWLAILDEFTRECLALRVCRKVSGRIVVSVLSEILETSQQQIASPPQVRTDNDELWRSRTLEAWLGERSMPLCFTARGSPWQNGVVEAFFGRLRSELPIHGHFADLAEAQATTDRWRIVYNTIRPHSALNYCTPNSVRQVWAATNND